MPDFRIGEAFRRVERLAAGQVAAELDSAAQTATESQTTPDAFSSAVKPDSLDVPASSIPDSVRPILAERAAQFPADGARWEALLHNALQLNTGEDGSWWFWTLFTFRVGGCQLVPHADAGWAIRFDAAKATTLQDEAGLLFASEAAYRSFAGKYLAPRRAELMKLLQWSSLGVLEEQGDMSWAWVDADRRRRAS